MCQFSVSSHKGKYLVRNLALIVTPEEIWLEDHTKIKSVSTSDFYLKRTLIPYLAFVARSICEGDGIFGIIFKIFYIQKI